MECMEAVFCMREKRMPKRHVCHEHLAVCLAPGRRVHQLAATSFVGGKAKDVDGLQTSQGFGVAWDISKKKKNYENGGSLHKKGMHSPFFVDILSCLDDAVCGTHIWAHVPSNVIAMILSMKNNTRAGFFRTDVKEWMLRCIAATTPWSICLDLNAFISRVYTSLPNHYHEDHEYMMEWMEKACQSNVAFHLCMRQCTHCSEIPTQVSKYSRDTTISLSTCEKVATCISEIFTGLSKKIVLAQFKVHSINVDSAAGLHVACKASQVVKHARRIFRLSLSDVTAAHKHDTSVVTILQMTGNFHVGVEEVYIGNIHLLKHPGSGCTLVHTKVPCMPVNWITAFLGTHMKRLIIRDNIVMVNELHILADLLWKHVPCLEELVLCGKMGNAHGNFGPWIVTAMSQKMLENPHLQHTHLKTLYFDVSHPTVQNAHNVVATNYSPTFWQDQYPLELLFFQEQHEQPIGCDLTCMSENNLPALECIHLRCNGILSYSMAFCIVKSIAKNRAGHKRIRNVYVYCDDMNPRLLESRDVYEGFENVYTLPVSKFPFARKINSMYDF